MDTRRARLFDKARFLSEQAIQVIETIENPQGLKPSADLNRCRAVLHCPHGSWTDSKSLRENGHGVITRETQRLQADPKLRKLTVPAVFAYLSTISPRLLRSPGAKPPPGGFCISGTCKLITNVYIDGFNFYYGALRKTPYRWVNPEKLCELLLAGNTIGKQDIQTLDM
jgi:hypothetical protein